MATLRITGTGYNGFGYTVEIDGVERTDVTKLTINYDAQDVITADLTLVVDELDAMAEISDAEALAVAKRMDILIRP
jgi:hypothetical protein